MYRLNPALKPFWRTRKPYKLLKGGRFSSKTHDAGGMAVYLARNYSLRFLCIRQFQNKISESVYTVLKTKIDEAGWRDEFDIGVSTIRHKITGSEFLFYGMARNIEEIKGTEGVDICWIEEGEGLTEAQWSIIDPTIRKEGAEIWVLWNPRLITDFVQVKLPQLLGDDCIVRHINYDENPFLSDTARSKAKRLKIADEDAYNHIYLGHPVTDDDKVIIKLSWVEAAIGAHIKLGFAGSGEKRVGYDVADSGDDKCANVGAHGSVAEWAEEWQAAEDELNDSCRRTYNAALAYGASIDYDCIGVGAHAGSEFKSINDGRRNNNGYSPIEYHKFNAGGAVVDPTQEYKEDISNQEFFENLKAQAWWSVADRFRNTFNAVTKGEEFNEDDLISISSDMDSVLLEKIKLELCTPYKDYSKNGKSMVESKKDLKKRGVPSPNLADAFIMAFAPRDSGGTSYVRKSKTRR